MLAHHLSDSLADFRDDSWIPQHANVRVASYGGGDVLELVMSVKVHVPAEFFELFGQTGFHKVNRTLIDTWPGL